MKKGKNINKPINKSVIVVLSNKYSMKTFFKRLRVGLNKNHIWLSCQINCCLIDPVVVFKYIDTFT